MHALWLGLGVITVLASLWSLWGGLGTSFIIFLTMLSTIAGWIYRASLYSLFTFRNSSKKHVITGVIVTLIIAATATLPGYVLDNDSYYIQTIMWLDQYGLVPGIANWHLFLAQQSGFHILEAGLNLEVIALDFNDLGLFITLMMSLWAIFPSQIKESPIQKAFRNLLILLLPLLLILGTAPSPDVPVILIHYYVIYHFLNYANSARPGQLNFMFFLVSLCCYFKITAVALVVLPLLLLLQQFDRKLLSLCRWVALPIIFGILFILKNTIASGYPLFPLTIIALPVDWLLPHNMAQFYSNATIAQAYNTSLLDLPQLALFEKWKLWYNAPGLEKWFNGIITSVLIFSAVLVIAYYKKVRFRQLLLTALFASSLLFISSPQARFFLPFVIPVSFLIALHQIDWIRKYSNIGAILIIPICLFLLISPSFLSVMTDNDRMKSMPQLSKSFLLYPGDKSRYNSAFAKAKINNINYSNPQADDFFYGTYDVPLPAAQNEYLEYFKYYYQVMPEYRGDTPSSGFRAVSP